MPPKQEIVSLKIRLRDIESVVKEAQSLMSKTVSVKRSKTFDIPKYFCLFCASFVCPVGRWVSRIWELINARMPVCRATAAAVTSRVLFTRTLPLHHFRHHLHYLSAVLLSNKNISLLHPGVMKCITHWCG